MSPAATMRVGPARAAERGSAALLAVVLVAVLTLVAVLATVLAGAVADSRRVAAAADLGALAGAAAAQQGEATCPRAAAIVALNRARMVSCTVHGGVVEVRASRPTHRVLGLGLTVSSRARAGPAGLRP
jgi:secretion/DNA translocation related TadE-like protein